MARLPMVERLELLPLSRGQAGELIRRVYAGSGLLLVEGTVYAFRHALLREAMAWSFRSRSGRSRLVLVRCR